MVRQKFVESVKPLNEPFGIIETIDADHQSTIAKACHQFLHHRRAAIAARQPCERTRLDSDRKTADLRLLAIDPHRNLAAGSLEHAHVVHGVAFRHQIANEISRIALGLKPDDVVFEQQRNELLVVGQRSQYLGWRKRNMQEESDAISMAAPSQRRRDGNHVIVMNPDQIILQDHLF